MVSQAEFDSDPRHRLVCVEIEFEAGEQRLLPTPYPESYHALAIASQGGMSRHLPLADVRVLGAYAPVNDSDSEIVVDCLEVFRQVLADGELPLALLWDLTAEGELREGVSFAFFPILGIMADGSRFVEEDEDGSESWILSYRVILDISSRREFFEDPADPGGLRVG